MVKDQVPVVGVYPPGPLMDSVPAPKRLRNVLLWLTILSVDNANEYVSPVPTSVYDHSGLAEPPGHENACQVTLSPAVPTKEPVGMPPTVTAEKAVAAEADPKNMLLSVTVPLISTSPVMGVA